MLAQDLDDDDDDDDAAQGAAGATADGGERAGGAVGGAREEVTFELFEKVLWPLMVGKERADGVRRSTRELKAQAQAKDMLDKVARAPLKASVVFREIVSYIKGSAEVRRGAGTNRETRVATSNADLSCAAPTAEGVPSDVLPSRAGARVGGRLPLACRLPFARP